MSNTKQVVSWDSDEELIEESEALYFDKDVEDELLGCSDGELLFDESQSQSMHLNTSQSRSTNAPSEGSDKTCDNPRESGELMHHESYESPKRRESNGDSLEVPLDSSVPDNLEEPDEPELSLGFQEEEEALEPDMTSEKNPQKREAVDKGEEEDLDYEDEEEEDDDNSRTRSRFTSERKQMNLRGISPRRNATEIPDTLELSKEDEKKIAEFVQQKSQRHSDRRYNNNNRNRNNAYNHHQQQQQQQRRRHNQIQQLQHQQHQKGEATGILVPPSALNLHLLRSGAHANVANTIANMAVNLMMLEKFSQRPMGQHISSMITMGSEARLRAPHTLLGNPTSNSAHFISGQPKFSSAPGEGNASLLQQQQHHPARLAHLRAVGQQQVASSSRDVVRMQMVGQEVRPSLPQVVPMLSQPIMERHGALPLMDGQQIQVITHQQPLQPQHLQPGLLQHGMPPINLNVPPPPHGQIPPTRFVQQPLRVVMPMNRPCLPLSAANFVQYDPAGTRMPQQVNVPMVRANFVQLGQGQGQVAPPQPSAGLSTPLHPPQPTELVGRPIETVMLRQAVGKNKNLSRPNSIPQSSNVSVSRQTTEKPKRSQFEIDEAEKLAQRAARFSKPVLATSVMPRKVGQEATNQVVKKRSLSPGAGGDECPQKMVRTLSNRKVIVKSGSQDSNVFGENNDVSMSGDGNYKDFELMKALEKQKKIREVILKKKEESRQMLAQRRRKSSEVLPIPALSSAIGCLEAQAEPVATLTKITVEEVDPGSAPVAAKPMKKLLMTKSQYKALVQHMKTKGIPLPKAVKEVSAKQVAGTADGVQGVRRVVQVSNRPGKLDVLPELSKLPSLHVPDMLPIPPAVVNHPRFSGPKVVVSGLAPSTKQSQLRSLAEKIGPIQSFHMIMEEQKALIKFHQAQHAQTFASRYNGSTIEFSVVSVSVEH